MHSEPSTESTWGNGPSNRSLERFRVLQDVEAIGSVAEACRLAGITKQTYYRWKKRYAASGLLGLHDRPIPPSPGRPSRLTDALRQMLLDHVRRYPTEGCVALSKRLAMAGIKVSSPTIQKALINWNLGSKESRVLWVRTGTPSVEPVQTIIGAGVAPIGSLECAKNFYFLGIPKGAGKDAVVPIPSLEQVASATGIGLTNLKAAATRENWSDLRGRFLSRIAGMELKERFHKDRVNMDSTAVTMAALGLQEVSRSIMATPDMSPAKILTCSSALKRSYHLLKAAFGGNLPRIDLADQLGLVEQVDELPRSSHKIRRRGKVLTVAQVRMAKRMFFLGIPAEGGNGANPRPSIHQVAVRLELPIRPLQHWAHQEGWVASRQVVDRWSVDYHSARLLTQIGPANLQRMIEQFYLASAALARLARISYARESNLTMGDICRNILVLSNTSKLCTEIELDDRILVGLVVPRRSIRSV